jgi:hypothetical protein
MASDFDLLRHAAREFHAATQARLNIESSMRGKLSNLYAAILDDYRRAERQLLNELNRSTAPLGAFVEAHAALRDDEK